MSKFAGYKTVRQLGQGSFGTVELVESSEKKLYALKSLLHKHLQNQSVKEKILKYFQREIDIMRKCDHPNLVKLVDFCCEENCYQILLEYCDEGNLKTYLKKLHASNELNEQKILDIFYQITSGFDYIHKINIIHRDIKPDNILFDKGTPKVADFGLSIALEDDKNIATTYVGTRITMAPEVLLHKEYSNKADIYSLGVLLYYMFYLTFPFNGKNEMDLCNNIEKGNIVFDQTKITVSKETQDLIVRMTHKYPEDRPDMATVRLSSCFTAQIERDINQSRENDKENIENMFKSCNSQEKLVEAKQNSQKQNNNNNSPTFAHQESTQGADQQTHPVQNIGAMLPKNNEIHLNVKNQQEHKKQQQYQFMRIKTEKYQQFLGLGVQDTNEISSFECVFTCDDALNTKIQNQLAHYRSLSNCFNEFIKFQQQEIYIHLLIRKIPQESQMSRNEEKFWEMIITYTVKEMEAALYIIRSQVDQDVLKRDSYLQKDMNKITIQMHDIILNLRKQWGQRLVNLEEQVNDKSQFMSQIQETAADICSAYFRRMNRAKEISLQSQYLSLQLLVWNLVQIAVGNQIDCWSGFALFNIRVLTISSDDKKNFIDSTPLSFEQ